MTAPRGSPHQSREREITTKRGAISHQRQDQGQDQIIMEGDPEADLLNGLISQRMQLRV
jgi:hypothetical protein